MKIKDWEKLCDESQVAEYDRQHLRVGNGLLLLAAHSEGNYGVNAEHDELFAGGESPKHKSWSDDDLRKMAAWGWRWDGDVESWAIFT